jgi:DNA-binding protein H-NS
MKTNARPFVREYKSRSPKMARKAPDDFFISGTNQNKMVRRESRGAAELSAKLPNRSPQGEAEALFTQAEVAPANGIDERELRDTREPRGRVLPCLLQEVRSRASENPVKVSNANTSNGTSASPICKKQRLNSRVANLHSQNLRRPSVSDEFSALSDLEILSLIEYAKIELARRKDVGKEKLRAEIESKLRDAGLDLRDLFEIEGKSARGAGNEKATVAPKFRDPTSGEMWSGRGRAPKWVAAIMKEREWTMEQFKQSDEFLIS